MSKLKGSMDCPTEQGRSLELYSNKLKDIYTALSRLDFDKRDMLYLSHGITERIREPVTLAGTIEPNGSSGVEETLSYKEAMHPGFLRSHCAREQSPGSDASDCGRGCYKFRSDRGATAESDTSDDSETDDDDDDVVQLLWEEIKDNFLRDTDDYRSDNSVSSDDECLEKTYGHNHVPYMPVPSYVLLHRGMDETPMVLVPWTRSLTDDSGEPLPLPPKVWPPKPKLADVRARRDPMPRPRGTHTYQRKDNYVTRDGTGPILTAVAPLMRVHKRQHNLAGVS
ncbi:hypothetical protein DL546_002958 [Coniochaeta pulveracea]|uniref:Uncharacterized protein n=1 Tax=Coniochaeta pulveracea TaxID=177199 RepID=A0A420YJA2_9PEZI|nr:hypothetical protein DL546_002958 [Coniochaeta pulveracea]